MTAPKVAFVGLGHMGGAMCARVAGAGFRVRAFDLRTELVADAVAAGAEGATSLADCAAGADVLVTMLPGPAQVEAVLLGAGAAVLAGLAPDALVLDMSTSSPGLGRRISAAAAAHGATFLDAPVADALRAPEGRLNVFVGGPQAAVARARPVLEAMGDPERVVHLGPSGAGYATKLLVNLQWFVHAAAAAEAMVVGVRAGLDLRTLHAVLASGPARSSFLEHEALEVLEAGEYGERFPLGLVAKDLRLALELVAETGVEAEVAATTARVYADARTRFGDHAGEMGAVALHEERAGVRLRFDPATGPPVEPVRAPLRIPPRPEMVLGAGAADSVGDLVRGLGEAAAFVVSDRGVVAAGIAGPLVARLQAAGLCTTLFADLGPNPSVGQVEAGATALRAFGRAAIVAVGGGSPIDAAKAIGIRAWAPEPSPPVVAVPTTAGTGAETNAFGVIDDPVAGRKRYVGHPSALPSFAVLDPLLGVSAPPLVTAACGIDVLAHAVESAQARVGNPYAAGLAGEAARIVFATLPAVVADGTDPDARAAMLMAAHLAGLAFATTGLGTAHAVGHALSARHGLSHGIALAAVLPEVVRLNAGERPLETARLAHAAGLEGEPLADAVARLRAQVGLESSLGELGVPDAGLGALADAALADEVIRNAPRVPTRDELLGLFEAAAAVPLEAVA